MEVCLSPERERFVRRLVDDGRYGSPSEAIEAAVRLLQERDASSPIKPGVVMGLEQVLAGRSVALTADDVVRATMGREVRR